MRRPWWTRLSAAVLALWLALVLGESGLVRTCAMHDRMGATTAATPIATHHAAAAGHGATDHRGPAHDHRGCTCIGCCVGGSVLALVPHVPTSTFDVALVPAGRWEPPVGLLPRPGPRHGRPYSTGPPRA